MTFMRPSSAGWKWDASGSWMSCRNSSSRGAFSAIDACCTSALPTFEVQRMTEFEKSTSRPSPSRRMPRSNT